jgi:hypothetical protein
MKWLRDEYSYPERYPKRTAEDNPEDSGSSLNAGHGRLYACLDPMQAARMESDFTAADVLRKSNTRAGG